MRTRRLGSKPPLSLLQSIATTSGSDPGVQLMAPKCPGGGGGSPFSLYAPWQRRSGEKQ